MNPLRRGLALETEAGRLAVEALTTRRRGDFRFGPLNVLVLVAIFVAGLSVHLNVHDFSVQAVVLALGSALIIAFDLWLWPSWAWAAGT